MSEIEVGEYIRTKSGKIYKIDKIKKCGVCHKPLYINIEKIKGLKFTNSYHAKDIKTHSKNIIDLIEYGDILEIFFNDNEIDREVVYGHILQAIKKGDLIAEDIKSILTHEQYEQNCYKVVE